MGARRWLGLGAGMTMVVAGALLATTGLGWTGAGVEDPALAIGGSLLCGLGLGLAWAARPFRRRPHDER